MLVYQRTVISGDRWDHEQHAHGDVTGYIDSDDPRFAKWHDQPAIHWAELADGRFDERSIVVAPDIWGSLKEA